jgi:hypothetical protein
MMWESRRLTALWALAACYTDSFTMGDYRMDQNLKCMTLSCPHDCANDVGSFNLASSYMSVFLDVV